MSNKSWKRLYQSYNEHAIGLVRDCVAALRARGMKTDAALFEAAPLLQTSPRRVRTLFHRDGEPVVLRDEWMALRYRAGLFFLNEAGRLRDLADRYEARAAELDSQQLEFEWGKECSGFTAGLPKSCGLRRV